MMTKKSKRIIDRQHTNNQKFFSIFDTMQLKIK